MSQAKIGQALREHVSAVWRSPFRGQAEALEAFAREVVETFTQGGGCWWPAAAPWGRWPTLWPTSSSTAWPWSARFSPPSPSVRT